jgi:putative tricarboxylic transport membrane protein
MRTYTTKKIFRLAGAAALATLLGATTASAAWPEKPVTIIVPFGAGGTTDITARTFQKAIADNNLSPQPFTVLNVTGGTSGSVGATRAATADPDGYTVLLMHIALMSGEASGKSQASYRQFDAVAGTTNACMLSVVPNDSPIKTYKQLMDETKANPNSLTMGTNLGAVFHMTTLTMENANPGSKFRLVQVGGEAKSIASMKGGHTKTGLLSAGTYLRYKDDGFRALAMLAPDRQPRLEDVPTAKEQGYDASFCIEHWWLAPKGTPKEAIDGLAGILKKAMETDYAKKVFLEDRGTAMTFDSGPGFAKKLDATYEWIAPLAKSASQTKKE